MLNYPLDVAFNCFDTFISKHVPLTFVEDSSVHTYAHRSHSVYFSTKLVCILIPPTGCRRTSCINQLFRLLVLYHDQPLCLFLDQNNLPHFRFSSQWVRDPRGCCASFSQRLER